MPQVAAVHCCCCRCCSGSLSVKQADRLPAQQQQQQLLLTTEGRPGGNIMMIIIIIIIVVGRSKLTHVLLICSYPFHPALSPVSFVIHSIHTFNSSICCCCCCSPAFAALSRGQGSRRHRHHLINITYTLCGTQREQVVHIFGLQSQALIVLKIFAIEK